MNREREIEVYHPNQVGARFLNAYDRLHYDTTNFRYRDTTPDRQRIAADTERFLAAGGVVVEVAPGVSGQKQFNYNESGRGGLKA